ncbi:hypothetical protein QJS10_CPB15g00632 [Acorus calamus]|uniref:Reverse transcriptase zinc-binding domain-containing protein n=1 Tax=Acorus calamus TaxID=4465 RepID=A0AAV9D554_ACOCL|nr:hypothetical protein QJS10_CPB15g00632 [Acorus calamus]
MDEAVLGFCLSDVIMDGQWFAEVLRRVLPEYWVNLIVQQPVPRCSGDGCRRWVWEGNYSDTPSTKDIYNQISQVSMFQLEASWKVFLRIPVFPKVQIFMWKLAWDRLPTRSVLDQMVCWQLIPVNLRPSSIVWQASNWLEAFTDKYWNQDSAGHLKRILMCLLMWCIWKMRNAVLFHNQRSNAKVTVLKALTLFKECAQWKQDKLNFKVKDWVLQENFEDLLCNNPIERQREPILGEPVFIITDGSVNTITRAAGAAFVLVGSNGQVFGAGFAGWSWSSPSRMEAEGIRLGVQVARMKELINLLLGSMVPPMVLQQVVEKKIGGYPASTVAKENMVTAVPPPMKD